MKVTPPNTTDTESEGEEHHEREYRRSSMVLKVCKTFHGNLTHLLAAKTTLFSGCARPLRADPQTPTHLCAAG